jgi:hypothetical protein
LGDAFPEKVSLISAKLSNIKEPPPTPLPSASFLAPSSSPTQLLKRAPMAGRRRENVNKRCLNCAEKRGREEYRSPDDCPSGKKKKTNPCTIFDPAVF